MSSCSLSVSYSDQEDPKIQPLTIFCTELAQRVDSLVFMPKIRRHVQGILEYLPPLCKEIEQEIKIYSPGNSVQRDAIITKIDTILTNVIHKDRFPETFKRVQIESLALALSPIKMECERLREEFFNEERRLKASKEAFEPKFTSKMVQELRE